MTGVAYDHDVAAPQARGLLPAAFAIVRNGPEEAPMSAQIGDEIMIMSQGLGRPVRQGEIRGIRHDPGGVVYLVQWSDTQQESQLPHGPDVVIKHRHGCGSGAVAEGATQWLSRLRHPQQWRHSRDAEQWQHLRDEQFAWRVEDIFAGLGLTHTGTSVVGGQIVHIPQVVSIDPGPPEGLDIQILPGQSPEDFSAHASAIAYDLGMAEVRVVPLGPALIRLELLPHDPPPGCPPPSG
ncbi:MAG TPA: DUF1918 domain-containing protein [Pseudonocardiaceae bacterium]|jgi:hypothetical protein|nr:DUF1918 domain-containing protein [Pseudonocardiaceae bacterium]